jgi:hypothetical protein
MHVYFLKINVFISAFKFHENDTCLRYKKARKKGNMKNIYGIENVRR